MINIAHCCFVQREHCIRDPSPIDFFYDTETGSSSLDVIKSDSDLLERIRNGQTANTLAHNPNGVIKVNEVFGNI